MVMAEKRVRNKERAREGGREKTKKIKDQHKSIIFSKANKQITKQKHSRESTSYTAETSTREETLITKLRIETRCEVVKKSIHKTAVFQAWRV